tara:strand:+ start:820 stop:1434 length:615 start_codon:yes stop_codon:yes gene_type:complete
MKKADKRKRRLQGMSESTKIRWAAEGKTTYEVQPNGLTDYSKPTGFRVERWGFYFKHDQTNEVTWLSDADLDYLGRREVKPTGQADQKTAFAYVLFKCATHSDGKAYTGERLNISWFTRFAVESGFTASEALECVNSRWFSEVKDLCAVMAESVGITNLPSLQLNHQIPSSHKMEHAKNVPFAQLILNRMSKHADTRFKDIDAD